jgi:hypothetical protein
LVELVKRYELVPDGDGVAPVERSDGEWVRFADVVRYVASSALVAMERDELERSANRYRKALVTIAGVPLTLPNAAAGVREAQRVISS